MVRIGVTGIALIRPRSRSRADRSGTSRAAATGPAQIGSQGSRPTSSGVDVGKQGRSPGDTEIMRQALFNRRVSRPRRSAMPRSICTFAIGRERRLPRHVLPAEGASSSSAARSRSAQVYELAVLGGTGLYDNARGTMTATRIKKSPRREFLLFRLVG